MTAAAAAVAAASAAALVAVVAGGCAPSATVDRTASDESAGHLREALAMYDSAGYLAGPVDFAVVGAPVVLPGPPDSAYLGFAASMPPAALRFAREDGGVAARYQVTMLVRSGGDTLAVVDRHETVRLSDFDQAGAREPRILFQRFVGVPAAPLRLDVTVRELSSRRQVERRFAVDARPRISRPLLALRADRRASLGAVPDLLMDPRHTVSAAGPRAPVVWLEDAAAGDDSVALWISYADNVIWADTVERAGGRSGLATATAALPVHRLPPGRVTLGAERTSSGTVTTRTLYIGLSPEWVPSSWGRSLDYLVHALDSDTRETWRAAAPEERVELWRRFVRNSDPDASTPDNEFLARYFRRMSTANARFDEPGRAGWETDRGEVLVKLGEADRERFIPPERQGDAPRIEWEYEQSTAGSDVIVFEDATDFGVYVMTPRSRVILRRLAERAAGGGDR